MNTVDLTLGVSDVVSPLPSFSKLGYSQLALGHGYILISASPGDFIVCKHCRRSSHNEDGSITR